MATVITVNESMIWSSKDQVVDVATSPTAKWFSLQYNVLDGSFNPMDSSGASQIGWWGTSLSNASGVFTGTLPEMVIDLDTAQVVPSIRVVGDDLQNDFPVDFTVTMYDALNVQLKQLVVTGNANVVFKDPLTPAINNVKKIVLSISKVNKPGRTVKLLDLVPLYEFYTTDTLKPNIAEASTERVSFTKADTVNTKLAESSIKNVSLTGADIIKPKLDEVSTANVSFAKTDILTPNLDETSTETVYVTSSDVLTPVVVDIHFITKVFSTSDEILTTIVEEPNPTNIINYDTWKVGTSGSQPGFNQNGSTAENSIVWDTDPFGNTIATWQAANNDVDSNADGGWATNQVAIDPTKLYRFSVWIRRKVIGNGAYYFGLYGYAGGVQSILNLSGTENTNPYFLSGGIGSTEWRLYVGYVFPHDHVGTTRHEDGGIYNVNGLVSASDISFKWKPTSTAVAHRTYLFYSTDPSTVQQWTYPRVEVVDGTEPSIAALLTMGVPRVTTINTSNDAILSVLAEASYADASLNSVDTLTPTLAESTTGHVSFSKSDVLSTLLSESTVIDVTAVASDVLSTKLTENSLKDVALLGTDAFPISLGEAAHADVSLNSADTVLAKVADTSALVARITSSDIIKVLATEIDFYAYKWFYLNDNILDGTYHVLASHGALPVSVSVVSGDTTGMVIAEVISIVVTLVSGDVLNIDVPESPGIAAVSITSADSLLSKLLDNSIVTAFINSNDTSPMLLLESSVIDVAASSSDSITVDHQESSTTEVLIGSSDLLDIMVTEQAHADVTVISNDSLSTKLLETSTEYVSFIKPDVLLPTLSEEVYTTVFLEDTDLLGTYVEEAVNVVVYVSSSDNLSPTVTDTSFFVLYAVKSLETLSIQAIESTVIRAYLESTETLRVITAEYVHVTNSFNSSDFLEVLKDVELASVYIDIRRSDVIQVNSEEEVSYMDNVYIAMDADERTVYGKVEITYTDPFNDESIIASASETGRFTDPAQLADNVTTQDYKWFSLHDNVLDGTYNVIPASGDPSVGWWGTTLSDIDGVLPIAPVVTLEFSSRSVISLKLIGDAKLDAYPVDFVMRLYDVTDTVVHTETVTGNTIVAWTKDITSVSAVVKITATITKINKAYSVVKLTEMFTLIVQTYYNDIIESINILEEIGYNTGSLPIGNISSNEVDIILSNDDRRFDLNNTSSVLYGFVKRNRRVRVWLGATVAGDIEWTPMGTYWASSWDVPKNILSATVTARDRLELLRLTDFNISVVYTNKTLLELFTIILDDAGLSPSEYDLDPSLADVTLPYAWFPKSTHREALTRLASCAVIQVYATKEGKIRVNLDLDATEDVMHTFDDDVNVYDTQYPLVVDEQCNYVEVFAKQWAVAPPEVVFSTEDAIEVVDTLVITFEFNVEPVTSISAPVITGSSGVSVDSYTLYSWGVEITFTNAEVSPGTISTVEITGTVLKETGKRSVVNQDVIMVRQDGKTRVDVEHDFIQSVAYANELGADILATFKESRYDVTISHVGSTAVRLGDKVMVNDSQDDVSVPYVVSRQRIRWDGFLQTVTEAKKL